MTHRGHGQDSVVESPDHACGVCSAPDRAPAVRVQLPTLGLRRGWLLSLRRVELTECSAGTELWVFGHRSDEAGIKAIRSVRRRLGNSRIVRNIPAHQSSVENGRAPPKLEPTWERCLRG